LPVLLVLTLTPSLALLLACSLGLTRAGGPGFAALALLGMGGLASGIILWDMARRSRPGGPPAAAAAPAGAKPQGGYAFRDELTGLFDRRFFLLRLEDEIGRYRRFGQPVSVVMLDVDGLRRANAALGRAGGDDILRAVADLLVEHSRSINVICRWGGDQFGVLLVETSRAGARSYAERLRRILADSLLVHGHRITASFGIACLPEDVVPGAEELIEAAQEAMEAARREGGNRVGCYARVAAPGFPSVADEVLAGVEPRMRGVSEVDALLGGPAALEGGYAETPRRVPGGTELAGDAPWEIPAAVEEGQRAVIAALAAAIAARDMATYAHSRRVQAYAVAIARAHGVGEEELRDIAWGVLLHDIGKIGIPDDILFKPGPLTPDQWQAMRTHPDIGRRILEGIPFLRGAVRVVYHHHERWDGTGYPVGLRGEAIPLGARIFAVADAFDAMTFDRPYSQARSFEAAREEVARSAGTHFDPAVVATFLAMPLEALLDIGRR
jgi:diguanylate cyclase (GGDEF)-like protein